MPLSLIFTDEKLALYMKQNRVLFLKPAFFLHRKKCAGTAYCRKEGTGHNIDASWNPDLDCDFISL